MMRTYLVTSVLSLLLCFTNAVILEKLATSCEASLELVCEEGEMIVVHEAAFTPHRGSIEECEKGLGVNKSSSERHNNR